jgi:uncharacterized protein YggE
MKRLIISALTLLCFSLAANSQSKNFIDVPYLEVNGRADSLVTPDQIYIKILLSEKDSRDKVPIEESENKMVAALKSLGINTEKDLVIRDVMSNYKTYLLKQKDIIKVKQYVLKVSDAVTTGNVFLKLEELGISNVSIERVDHSEMEKIRNICRSKAAGNAKASAQALTTPLGQVVGPAIHISENQPQNPDGYYRARLDEVVVTAFNTVKQDKTVPIIDFEKIKVESVVNITFLIK